MNRLTLKTLFLSLALATVGPLAYAQQHNHSHSHDHHHHHEAPHGGTLISLGDHEAHLELVLDAATGEMTGYVLDAEAEKALRSPDKELKLQVYGRDVKTTTALVMKAVANPLTGETVGNTSQFQVKHDVLKGKKQFTVYVESITIRGAKFTRTASYFPEGNH